MERIVKTPYEQMKIIEKHNFIPVFEKEQMQLTAIAYYPFDDGYEKEEITEAVISSFMEDISKGIEAYLYLDEYAELEFMNVVSDGTWISLAYNNEDIWYVSYNADFEGIQEDSPLEVGGQSPVEKYYALLDIELGKKAVEYFIYTGKLYPGIDWATPLEETKDK